MEMKRYKLGEICELNNATLKSSDNVDEILYLDTSNITENCIDELQSFFIKNSPSRAQRKVKDKTIIFSTIQPNQKHFGILNNPPKNLIVSTGFTTLDVKKTNDFDANYVYLKLTQPYIVNHLQTLAQNSVSSYPSINPDDIGNLRFDFPPLPTQQKIAAVLTSLDDKIALNKKINARLEALAKRLYDYWFVQFNYPDKNGKPYKTSGGKMVWNEVLKREIPEGWEVVEMSSVIKQINTGLNPRDNFILGNGKIKYVTVKNLTEEGHIDFSNCDLVNSEAQKIIHERSQIQTGDILFASICPLGRCYLIQDSPEEWDINESVFSIRPNIDRITSEFLYTLLRESYYVKKMTQKATGSIFKGIRINDIEKIEILLPPKDIINAFSKKTLPIFNYQLTIQKEIQKLTDLRDPLLPLLMNGQVEVSTNNSSEFCNAKLGKQATG